MVNGQLVSMVNGQLVQMVNGQLVSMVNGQLVQIVNGQMEVNSQLVQFVNGQLVPMINGQLVQFVNGQLVPMINGSLVQMVNGQLVQMVNGQLVQMVNSNTIGAGAAGNNTAVIIDQSDAIPGQFNWLGAMFGINMITGLDAGQQTLIPGVLVNSNFDITYGLGTVSIEISNVVITPDANQNKIYGDADPAFTFTNNAGLTAADFTGTLSRTTGNNAGTYAYTLSNLSAGPNYVLSLSSVVPVSTFAITARPIIITPTANQSKVYGSANPVYSYTASETLISGDSFTGVLGRDAGENIGFYNITQGTLSLSNNYTLSFITDVQFEIKKKAITVTPNAGQNKIYGNANPIYAYAFSPALTGTDVFTGTLDRVAGDNVGFYNITQGTLSLSNNYTLSFITDVQFEIKKKAITVTPNAGQNKTYGNANPIYAYGFSPALTGTDAFTGALSRDASENVGFYNITQDNLSLSSNYTLSFITGVQFEIKKKTITVTPNAGQSKLFGESDPVSFSYNFTPTLVTGDNFSGLLARDAGENIGLYNITQGTLGLSNNYTLSFTTGVKFEIKSNPCILTHSAFKSFNNTPLTPVSLWVNMTTKVSGQLSVHGDFLLFKTGSITFNNIISSTQVNNLPMPSGKVVADNLVTKPVTNFDATNNIWITKVPVGYSSTSDIFVTGVIVYSSIGFVKGNGNSNTVMKGAFYSNKTLSDQWAYGIAPYRPFDYPSIAASGDVVSINGDYRAGTPIPQIPNYIGGGNSYSGSSSSFDNYTSCYLANLAGRANNSRIMQAEQVDISAIKELMIFPNPATETITVSFVASQTGSSKIVLYSLDGRKVIDMNNGVYEAGKRYQKQLDVRNLVSGVYLLQIWNGISFINNKVVISH